MTNVARHAGPTGHMAQAQDQLQFRLIYASSFVVCLAGATLCRLTGGRFRPWPPGPTGYRSIVAEARSAANTVAVMAMTTC